MLLPVEVLRRPCSFVHGVQHRLKFSRRKYFLIRKVEDEMRWFFFDKYSADDPRKIVSLGGGDT